MKELRHLNKYFIKYKYRFLLGVIFVIASNLFSVFPAKSVQRAIDELYTALEQNGNMLDNPDLAATISKIVLYCTFLVLLFAAIRGIFMFFMRQSLIVMSRKIEYDLKNEIFNHYQQLDQAFYRKNNTGDLMARITEDVSRVRMYIGPAIMYFTNLSATFLVVLPAMFAVHPRLAIYVLLPLPVLSFCVFYVNNIINRRSDLIQQQLSVLTSFTQEAYNGIRVIKAFGVETYSQSALTNHVNQFRKYSMSLAKVDATFFPLMIFLTGLSTVITIFAGGMMVINHEITIGNIAEYIFYVNLLVWPVASLGYTSSLIQRAAASQKRINEFLQTKPEITSDNKDLVLFDRELAFKDVTFTYPGKTIPALADITFTLKKGKTIGILGTTGSGKSTIAQMLLRMMDTQLGQISLDDTPIKDLDITAYRDKIGYVPQDLFLFSDTIYNNITFGLKEVNSKTPELVREVLEEAALGSTIRDFPNGLQTLIGERGIMLSGGQKQRVSIARALIKKPEILILDDCLSAVDTNTEAQILQSLEKYKGKTTLLIISHRVSAVKDADLILILDNGKLVEQGTHQTLMNLKSRYHTMYEKQRAEEKLTI